MGAFVSHDLVPETHLAAAAHGPAPVSVPIFGRTLPVRSADRFGLTWVKAQQSVPYCRGVKEGPRDAVRKGLLSDTSSPSALR